MPLLGRLRRSPLANDGDRREIPRVELREQRALLVVEVNQVLPDEAIPIEVELQPAPCGGAARGQAGRTAHARDKNIESMSNPAGASGWVGAIATLLLTLDFGCGAQPNAPAAPGSSPAANSSEAIEPRQTRGAPSSTARRADANAVQRTAQPRGGSADVEPEPLPQLDRPPFVKELDEPILQVFVEAPPFVGALGIAQAFLRGRQGWSSLIIPASARSSNASTVGLFLGRDFRLRLMGTTEAAPARTIYLRGFETGFRPAPEEIAKLARGTEPLFGVLGLADPEVVCRAGDVCLVKSVRGWRTVPAPPEPGPMVLDAGRVLLVSGAQLWELRDQWQPLGPPGPWERADALAVVGDSVLVVETAASRLHHLTAATFTSHPSPIERPRSVFSLGSSFWLAGSGLAYFDGTRYWRHTLRAELNSVDGTREELWLGGPDGLYRGQLPPAPSSAATE